MYVIADIEWLPLYTFYSLTQIAAVRVDANWNITDEFSSFVRPLHGKIHSENHVSYTGGAHDDFLSAPKINTVLSDFQNWMKDDDIILWWHYDSKNKFRKIIKSTLGKNDNHKMMVINERICTFVEGKEAHLKGQYKLAEDLGISTKPELAHFSKNDVRVLRELLVKTNFPQEELLSPHIRTEQPSRGFLYKYDPKTNMIHKSGCPETEGVNTNGHNDLKKPVGKGYKPCECCKDEYLAARKKRNSEIIRTTSYSYIFSPDSKTFHKRTCGLILSAKTIIGTGKYETALNSGRTPCKICNPTENYNKKVQHKKEPLQQTEMDDSCTLAEPKFAFFAGQGCQNFHLHSCPNLHNVSNLKGFSTYKEAVLEGYTPCRKCKPTEKYNIKPTKKAKQNTTSKAEKRAVARQQVAAREREAFLKDDTLSGRKINDIYTLTQPRFSFWVGKGYQNFHLHSCPHLHNISDLKGFSTYKEAILEGYTPCRKCKPTSKHDAVYSIPITSQARTYEKIEVLEKLCVNAGYNFHHEDAYFCLNTPVGRWKIDTVSNPIKLKHINLVLTPYSTEYHKQPRLFLSYTDAFNYIKRHDDNLAKKRDENLTEITIEKFIHDYKIERSYNENKRK